MTMESRPVVGPHLGTLIALAASGALATNIFLPSLPNIARHFNTEYAMAQLLVSVFLAATASIQIIVGPLSDRYGRRPVVLWFLAAFAVATVAAIYAPDIETLLALRVLQATAVAGMVIARAVVRDTVRDMEQAASRLGYVTMGMSIMPMIGPMMGGVLDELYGWQATFWLTLALGLMTFALAWFDLPETNQHRTSSMTEQFRVYPELLRTPLFWCFALAGGFSSAGFFSFLGGAPFIATTMLGVTPSQYGFYFALVSVGYMVGNFTTARFGSRFGNRNMIQVGGVISLLSVVLIVALYQSGHFSALALFGCAGILCIGNGMTMPNTVAGMVSVRPQLAGSASGLGGTIQMGTGAILSYVAGAVIGPGTGPMPMFIVMGASLCMALLMGYILRRAGRLSGAR